MERFKRSENNQAATESFELNERGEYTDRNEIGTPDLRISNLHKYCKVALSAMPTRYTIAIMIFLGFMITFGMRKNLSAIDVNIEYMMQIKSFGQPYFYMGYVVSLVLGGFLSFIYPANKVFGLSIGGSSLFNLLAAITMSLKNGKLTLWVCLLQGLVEGAANSSFIGILRYWAPPMERSRLVTFACSGALAGVFVSLQLTKQLIDAMDHRAPFVFYGLLGIIWYVFWNWLCFESPRHHPTISPAELEYIEASLEESEAPFVRKTVCGEMMRSMPVYAIIVSSFCICWNYNVLLRYLYAFIKQRFAFDMHCFGETWLFLILAIVVHVSGVLADYLRKKRILSTTNVRKVFFCAGFGIEALIFLLILNTTRTTSALLGVVLCVVFSGFGLSVYIVNHLDIAQGFATILTCISYGIAVLAHYITNSVYNGYFSNIPKDSLLPSFTLAVCVQLIGCIFYAIFASGELQPWAKPKPGNGEVLAFPANAIINNYPNTQHAV